MNPKTAEEIQEMVRSLPALRVRGSGTKTALSAPSASVPSGVDVIQMGALSGILEYNPGEFTFTALAGTPVQDIELELARHGQFLPFDPVLVEQGATLGGTVASGLSGPGRYRYGGVRDFILGVRFVDGQANLVSAGGKVVKNAAGFDLPKLMVGSLGRFGVLTELTFKVFPRPAAWLTQSFAYPSLDAAVSALNLLANRPLELLALELEPEDQGASLHIRLGGASEALAARCQRVASVLDQQAAHTLDGDDDAGFWQRRRELAWVPPGWLLAKIPITPQRVAALEQKLAAAGSERKYSAGLCQAWVAWSGSPDDLDRLLFSLGLSGLAILDPKGDPAKRPSGYPLLGILPDEIFYRRVRLALDPLGKLDLYATHHNR